MIKVILPLLLLFSCYLPGFAQCEGPLVPYKVQIGGRSDSITVEAILQAGRIGCSNKAFEVVSFRLGFVGTGTGCYSELQNTTDSLSPLAVQYIRRLPPGSRLYVDCVRVKNSIGKEYLLKPAKYRIYAKLPK